MATTVALCAVPLLMLASKFEQPTPEGKLSLMQLALRQGMLCMAGCITVTIIGWPGMSGIGIAVTNFAVACEMCKGTTMLLALTRPTQTTSPGEQADPAPATARRWAHPHHGPHLFTEKDRKRYSRAMCLFHLGIIAPAAVAFDIVQPARLAWFRVQPLEWLNLSWLLGLSLELGLLVRMIARMSRRLRFFIVKSLEASAVNGTDGAERLRGLEYRLRILSAVYSGVLVALQVLIWAPFVLKSLFGFFPLTTLCFCLALCVGPCLNFVTYLMVQLREPESAGFRSLLHIDVISGSAARVFPRRTYAPSSAVISSVSSRASVVG